jgi:hypothetical protein
MTIQYSTTIRNARLDSDETVINVSPHLRMYTGGPPTNCAAAATGTLLADMVLPSDWMAAASGGQKAKSGIWQVAATAAGTFGHYRIWDSAVSVCHEQGTLGLAAGSPDMVIDSASCTIGQTITVTAYTKTASGA